MCLSLSSLLSLVLVLGVSLGASLPHDVPRNGCRLSKYQNIAPEEKKAVDKMRQEFVSIAGDRGHKCNTRLFYRKWKAADLPVRMSDRVLLVAAELNLTTAMLELPAVPSFAQVRRRPLQFFRQAREDVLGCVSASPRVDPSQQPSGRLRHWLHKLQAAVHTSTACLRATTILHALQPECEEAKQKNSHNIKKFTRMFE
uniref:IFNL3 protein n=1 Tax=Cyanistes caeruleus TaxID=156563 RepID=A0A8C0Z855_CYACU